MDKQFLLLAQLPPLLRVGVWQRTRVAENLDALDVEIADSRDVDFGSQTVVGAAHVTIEGDRAVALALGGANLLTRGEVLETVGKHVGMLITEDKRAELHDGDEAGEVEDFGVGIASVEDTGEVEELSTLVNLGPKALFQRLLGSTEGSGLLNEVKVAEDADDFRETVGL